MPSKEISLNAGPACGTFSLHLAALALALAFAPSHAAPAADSVPKFSGAQSCASAMCHGGADDQHNQFITWTKKDFHTRAPATLSLARSARIAETLKIADATAEARCTVCHNPFQAVPDRRKDTNRIARLEGVSCESCHNASENWFLTHTRTDLTHAQKVSAGLRDLKDLYVRANTCVACHQNLEPDLRAAGHPELTFELDGQSAAMPRHWAETNRFRGAQSWLVGQAVALREAAAQSANSKDNDEKRRRATALAWLLGVEVDPKTADVLAQNEAAQTWTKSETLASLNKLVARHDAFTGPAGDTGDQPQRAERIALGVERHLVALQWQKNSAVSNRLDQLFKDIQSRPDFVPKQFGDDLKALANELKTLPSE